MDWMPKEAEGRRGPKGDVQIPVCRADGGAVPRETWARGNDAALHCGHAGLLALTRQEPGRRGSGLGVGLGPT